MTTITSKLGRIAVIMVAVVTMAGCASTPNTYANADPSANFAQFQTYGFVPAMGTDTRDYQSLQTNYLKSAIGSELQNRGMSESNSPDLLINFHVHTKEKIRSHSVPTGHIGAFYDPFWDTWGGYGGWRTEVRQYTEGTLTIDVVDANSNKLVWEGAAVGRVTNKDLKDLRGAIDSAVTEIMKSYPVIPANS